MSAEKRWVLKEQGEPAKVARLATALEIPPVLANLLVQRGIETEEEAWQFFNPKLENLHDPFLMKDMDRAVERIDEAVKRNEPIMVYGDYDVDGTTAVALVYSFLRRLGLSSLLFYIPDRYTEGYGISVKAIDYAQRKGVGLIIALDCGIKRRKRSPMPRPKESTLSSATITCRGTPFPKRWRCSTPSGPTATIRSRNCRDAA